MKNKTNIHQATANLEVVKIQVKDFYDNLKISTTTEQLDKLARLREQLFYAYSDLAIAKNEAKINNKRSNK